MEFNAIDWNAMWQEESKHSQLQNISRKERWDKRADNYSRRIDRAVTGKEELKKDDYIYQMLDRIEVKPEWTVLDIGCGPGTLTIPLARKVKSVTALDISSEMLKHLKINADNSGISNIRYLNSSWQDAFAGRLAGVHDVVVASRSLMSGDMKEAMSNIIAITGQAAYLTFPAIHLPFDWEVYRAIGRTRQKHPPYIYIYNMLYQMGKQANVEMLSSRVKVQFRSIDEAIASLQWRTEPFTTDEEARLRDYLERKFAEQENSPVFTHEGKSKWALIWWKKEDQE